MVPPARSASARRIPPSRSSLRRLCSISLRCDFAFFSEVLVRPRISIRFRVCVFAARRAVLFMRFFASTAFSNLAGLLTREIREHSVTISGKPHEKRLSNARKTSAKRTAGTISRNFEPLLSDVGHFARSSHARTHRSSTRNWPNSRLCQRNERAQIDGRVPNAEQSAKLSRSRAIVKFLAQAAGDSRHHRHEDFAIALCLVRFGNASRVEARRLQLGVSADQSRQRQTSALHIMLNRNHISRNHIRGLQTTKQIEQFSRSELTETS